MHTPVPFNCNCDDSNSMDNCTMPRQRSSGSIVMRGRVRRAETTEYGEHRHAWVSVMTTDHVPAVAVGVWLL